MVSGAASNDRVEGFDFPESESLNKDPKDVPDLGVVLAPNIDGDPFEADANAPKPVVAGLLSPAGVAFDAKLPKPPDILPILAVDGDGVDGVPKPTGLEDWAES